METVNTAETAAQCEVIFLAVHPPVMMDTILNIKPFLKKESLLVSLAPKVTMAKINTVLEGYTELARVNPSATGVINQGINPVAVHENISEDNKQELITILSILGKTPIVDESKIEAYAVISAMGSTYLWFQLKKLQELGIQFGMSENEAKQVVTDMVKSTADTLFNSDLSPEEVMDLVPVKPLGDYEETIKTYYNEKLTGIFDKIKP